MIAKSIKKLRKMPKEQDKYGVVPLCEEILENWRRTWQRALGRLQPGRALISLPPFPPTRRVAPARLCGRAWPRVRKARSGGWNLGDRHRRCACVCRSSARRGCARCS